MCVFIDEIERHWEHYCGLNVPTLSDSLKHVKKSQITVNKYIHLINITVLNSHTYMHTL